MNMKHAGIGVLASLALVLGFAGTSLAVGFTNSGEYMFTMSGNDSNTPLPDLESAIEDWFTNNGHPQYSDIDLSFYDKDESVDGMYSDEWMTDAPVDFYSVKAGKQFAFYWENPATDSGSWSTEDLLVGNDNIPAISHISFWKMNGIDPDDPDNPPVPEPSTVFLMGLGLAGLGVTSYRKRRRK